VKVIILAGGYGTRLSELTQEIPKPLVDIGGYPIIWHIMKLYSAHGFNDFIIALGYKGQLIKDYFLNYHSRNSNFTLDISSGSIEFHDEKILEGWKVTLVDTGEKTMTGGRIKRLAPYLDSKPFMLTYGDGLSNVDLTKLAKFHQHHGKQVTVTSTHPSSRYGKLDLGTNDEVRRFVEKPEFDRDWINGGFFVMDPSFLSLINSDETVLEKQPLEFAAESGQLVAFKHDGFWQCMDTIRDKALLNDLWESKNPPWKCW